MIRHVLDCSSGHPSPDTWAWLDDRLADDGLRDPRNLTAAGIGGGRTRYGWFIYASTEACIEMPADLWAVCVHARRRGAEYILFDCDAAPDQDLPVLHPDFLASDQPAPCLDDRRT